MSVKYSKKTVS